MSFLFVNFVFILFFYPATSVAENAAMLLCCEAP